MNNPRFITKTLQTILICVGIITALCGCAREKKTEKNGFALDTFISVTVYGNIEESIVSHAVEMCSEYEDVFSAVREGSELKRLNDSGKAEVSDELLHVIRTGLEYSELSGGAFDVTILPVKDQWDFNEERLPESEALREALQKVDYRNVEIAGNTVTLHNGAMLDLGAVAKGYIADRIKDYLREEGVTSAIINLGGNVLCIGRKPDGEAFQIGIRKPFAGVSDTIDVVAADDCAVVSSGVYERCFEKDGVNYHHILNPKTGYPYDNGILGISVICDSSETADALSTAAFCLGTEEGAALAKAKNARVLFIMEDYSIIYGGH